MKFLFLALFSLVSATSFAEMKLESTRFKVGQVLELCADCTWKENLTSDDSTPASANTGFVKYYVLQGALIIRETDSETFETRKTVIPAHIKLAYKGAGLRSRTRLSENVLKIRNVSGRQISEIFGTYRGIRTGATVLLVGLGLEAAVNKNAVVLGGLDTLVQMGIGIDAFGVKAQMVPGLFSRDQTVIEGEANIESGQGKTSIQKQSIESILQQRIGQ